MLSIFSLFLSLTVSLLLLSTPASAQAGFVFAYFVENTGCHKHVPQGSDKTQLIATSGNGQCVPVANSLSGTFDVSISGKIYWTNGLTPALKACPTIDCDMYEDNGCFTMWEKGKWSGHKMCRRMTETYYWAMGTMPMLPPRKRGEIYNGTYSNATDLALE